MKVGVTADQLKRGTQIAYIPTHAEGDLGHPDVEYGFVTSVTRDFAFCRYWRKGQLGQLRTKANGEATYFRDLVLVDRVPEEQVQEALEQWC